MADKFNVTEPLIAKVATLAISGLKEHAIAKKLNELDGTNFTWRNIKIVMQHHNYKNTMEELTRATMSVAKTELRQGMSLLVPEIIRVIKHNLTDNKLQALQYALKILGFDVQDEAPKQAQQIVVNLPNMGKVEKDEI